MNNDLELLEAAAKAAGLYYWLSGDDVLTHDDGPGLFRVWNPLEDDGDALRLAVKLRIDISHMRDAVRTATTPYNDCYESNGTDAAAATRRAIVRTAAAIEGAACTSVA